MVQKIKEFSEIISPMTEGEFFGQCFGKSFRIFKGDSERFRYLLTWAEINRMLKQHRLEPPRLRLVKDKNAIPDSAFIKRITSRRGVVQPKIILSEFSRQLHSGATLILDAVNEMSQPITELAEIFENSLAETIQVNAYVALSNQQGFDLHWDDHDVFVLQASGKKKWRVYPATRLNPLHFDVDRNVAPPAAPLWEGVLTEGDVLYLPRGWWHEAKPIDGETLHLSVGVTRRTGVDFLEWLKEKMCESEEFRMSLPRLEGSDALRDHLLTLKEHILHFMKGDILVSYLEETDAKNLPRNSPGLPYSADPNAKELPSETVLKFATNREMQVRLGEDNKTVVILAMSKKWVFSIKAMPFFVFLQRKQRCTVKESIDSLSSNLKTEEIHGFLLNLLQKGLLVIDE